MPMDRNGHSSERDLVLPPNSHVFILNKQKGVVDVFCGPHKSNLDASSDQPVVFDYKKKKFNEVALHDAITTNFVAPEGWYLVLKNPAIDNKHPSVPTTSPEASLLIGQKINIPGPVSFALFPGQMCKVIKGHHLKSNQFLICRVYDPEKAMKDGIDSVLISSQETEAKETGKKDSDPDESQETEGKKDLIEEKKPLVMGQLVIIKGTDVSFYMPPTGVEVVPEDDTTSTYVRDAVTLERLEYCVLLDEDGNKEYIHGPAVVFPKPTQQFITKNGSRKYRAIGLNEISGIHLKVTKGYKDEETDRDYKPGNELFITGKETAIYYPREEHAIVKYDGEGEIHFATAVPSGEGRYVMNRLDGEIILEKGPQMLLPDPRTKVIIRRILTREQVVQWFPGNTEAINYNEQLAMTNKSSEDFRDPGYISDRSLQRSMTLSRSKSKLLSGDEFEVMGSSRGIDLDDSYRERTPHSFAGDRFDKKATYTKPRMITLDSKFDGAVRISIWRGYAVAIESKSGDSTEKVIIGPKPYILEYDENLVTLELSTGTPKIKDSTIKTPYLRILNNKVSDEIKAETKDFVEVRIRLSYMVDFKGEPEKWFAEENYVLFLTERMGSIVRNMIKRYGIEDFYTNAIDLIRDLILGVSPESSEDGDNKPHERPGREFKENGMWIKDVEILNVTIGDAEIAHLLTNSQTEVVEQTLNLAREQRNVVYVKEQQKTIREEAKELHNTEMENIRNSISISVEKALLNVKKKEEISAVDTFELEVKRSQQDLLDAINGAKLKRQEDVNYLKIAHKKSMQDIELEAINANTKAFIDKFKSIHPRLIAAIQTLGDKNVVIEMSKNLSVQTMLGGGNLVEIINKALTGTVFENFDLKGSEVPPEVDEGDEYWDDELR